MTLYISMAFSGLSVMTWISGSFQRELFLLSLANMSLVEVTITCSGGHTTYLLGEGPDEVLLATRHYMYLETVGSKIAQQLKRGFVNAPGVW